MATVQELGDKIKAKYPGSYDDMDSVELGRKTKLKYPGSYDDFEDISIESPLTFAQKQAKPFYDSIQATADENTRIQQEYKPLASGVLQTLNTGAGAINAAAEAPLIREAAQPIAQGISSEIEQGTDKLAGGIVKGTQFLDKLTGLPYTEALGSLYSDETESTLQDIGKATGNLANIAGTVAGVRGAKTGIGKVANLTGTDPIIDLKAHFDKYQAAKKFSKVDKTVKERVNVLEKIEASRAGLRKLDEKNRTFNQNPRKAAAESDYLVGSVDDTGTVRTIQEGGAVDRVRAERIDPVESTVRDALVKEKRSIAVADVEKKLNNVLRQAGVEGVELTRALNSIKSDIEGLQLRAREMGALEGTIPVSLLHDTKIAKADAVNYLNVGEEKVGKARVRAFKELVEDNADFNVKDTNRKLSEHLALIEYLKKLDGTKVEGGRLGKYAAQATGMAVGDQLGKAVEQIPVVGPLLKAGSILLGREIGTTAQGRAFKKTFGKNVDIPFEQKVTVPETKTLLLPEKATTVNAIQKEAVPVLPRGSRAESAQQGIIADTGASRQAPVIPVRQSIRLPGPDMAPGLGRKWHPGNWTTPEGQIYAPTPEQQGLWDTIDNSTNKIDELSSPEELNKMDRKEALDVLDKEEAEVSIGYELIKEELDNMGAERRLYNMRNSMKERTFTDRDFNPRDGNRLPYNSKGYLNKQKYTSNRNKLLESLMENGRMYNHDNWDQNATMANDAADSYARLREQLGVHQKALRDIKVQRDNLKGKKKANLPKQSTSKVVVPSEISSSTDNLISEAKKYKSAEEFVRFQKGSSTQYGDYSPEVRAENIPAGYQNITELGVDPEEIITIYRGIDDLSGKVKKKINDGDFVTTDFDSALSYSGNPKNVVEMQVPASSLYNSEPRDFADDPFYTGAEYIYTKKITKHLPSDSQLREIWNRANKK
jgi:hypothetical protein